MVSILLEKLKNDTWFIENSLFRAIKNNQQNIVNLFIEQSGLDFRDVQTSGGQGLTGGQTPLHVAVTTKNVELVKSCIGLCDIDSTDSDGNTALHLAAYQKGDCIEIVKLLVDNGAKVDLQNKKKETPYRRASSSLDWTNDEVKNFLKQFEKK